jgi:hypothetical protein
MPNCLHIISISGQEVKVLRNSADLEKSLIDFGVCQKIPHRRGRIHENTEALAAFGGRYWVQSCPLCCNVPRNSVELDCAFPPRESGEPEIVNANLLASDSPDFSMTQVTTVGGDFGQRAL